MRILLVEDEKRMAQALCEILRLENYEMDHYDNGPEGLAAAESEIYDIVILDVMLPGMNGYDIAKRVRSQGITTPILMLTAKAELDDKVTGLDSGADDYLTKPFMTKELLARLRALGRRTPGTVNDILYFADITLDTKTLMLSCTANGQSVRLGEKEYRILECLIANSGQVQRPNKNIRNEGMGQNTTQERQPSSSASWAIIGVSILVLAFGLVFAFTYKRRK